MIMAALGNALNGRAIQRYFAADPVAWAAHTYLREETMSRGGDSAGITGSEEGANTEHWGMRLLRPASEDEMVAVFLTAEVGSERYGPQIRQILASLGQPCGIVEHPDTGDEAANTAGRVVTPGRPLSLPAVSSR